jgi:hypothetical protein
MIAQRRDGSAGGKLVFLHIGAPKTGSTYLQQVLFKNRETLAANGVLYPYSAVDQSFRSAHDFCGTTWFGHHATRFRGEWDRVAERARDWGGSTYSSAETATRARGASPRSTSSSRPETSPDSWCRTGRSRSSTSTR